MTIKIWDSVCIFTKGSPSTFNNTGLYQNHNRISFGNEKCGELQIDTKTTLTARIRYNKGNNTAQIRRSGFGARTQRRFSSSKSRARSYDDEFLFFDEFQFYEFYFAPNNMNKQEGIMVALYRHFVVYKGTPHHRGR